LIIGNLLGIVKKEHSLNNIGLLQAQAA